MAAHDHDHDHDHHDDHHHGDHGHGDHAHPGLDVQVELKGSTHAAITIKVEPDEFTRARELGLKHLAKHTRIKGFRPGKTPLKMVEKMFGARADHDTIQHFVNHAYDQAVREHSLRPAAHPRVDFESLERSAEGGFEHVLEIPLRPSIELGQYKGLAVEGQSTDVTDEEFEGTLEDLRRRHSKPEPAGDDGLPADGMAVAKLEFLVEGSDDVVLDRDGMRLSPQSPPPGVDPKVFEEGLSGARVGDTKEFPCEFEEGFPEEAAVGKKGTCRVTLSEAVRFVPPTDEELCKGMDAADMDELHGKIREHISSAKERNEKARIENLLLDRLIQDHPMELPPELIEAQTESKVAELRQSLEGQGLDPAALEERLEAERQSAAQATDRAMRAIYLMEEIARAESLQVTAEDVKGELETIAERNSAKFEDVRKYYQEQGLFQHLGLELLERKVRNFLREAADITVVA